MAPINPVQILDAFTPLLTENGGIKSAVDQSQFEKIYDIMKNFSTKLVSKCIYYQILVSTSSDVLEKFLKIGGWDLICLWVKSSRDSGNVTFLLDLLKLLQILPMNIDRLRENECPKIVKKLCKHENQDIALKANQIIKKWTKIIQQLSEKNPNNSSNGGGVHQTKEKKRKSIDSTVDSSNGSKKTKTESDNKIKTAIANNTDVSETSTRDETILVINSKTDTSMKDGDTIPIKINQLVRRPVTAKVKPGKFRLDLSIPSTTNKSGTSGGDKVKNNKMNKSSLEAKNLLKNDLKSNLQHPMLKTPPPSASKLKDSMSFMDALSMMPVVGKKRRKSSNIINNNIKESENNNNSINKQSQDNNDNIVSNKTDVILSSINNQNVVLSEKQQFSKSPQVNDIISNSLNLKNETTSVANISHNSISGSNNNSKNDLMIMSSSSSSNNSNNSGNNWIENSEKNINSVSNNNGGNNSNENQQKSPPRFSFYKDILDEKCKENEDDDQNDINHDDNTNGDNSQESQKSLLDSADVAPVDSLSDDLKQATGRNSDLRNSDDPLKMDQNDSNEEISRLDDKKTEFVFVSVADGHVKPKPILCYVKKNSKKSVRWPDDDTNLEQVKYFELDETERINVTRPSAENMKRFDMKHEAQMMSEAKKGRCFTYAPWRLIAIDLDPINVPVERGKDSREKHIQMERMKTTLECFYFHNQIPDSPDEPENSFELISDSNLMDKPRIIPLEDENTVVMDRGVQDYVNTNTMTPTSTSNIINHLGAIGGGLALGGMMEHKNLSYNNINDNVNYINTGDMNNSYLPYNSAQLPPIQAGVNPNYLPPPNTNSYQNPSTNYLPSMSNNQGASQFDGNSAAGGVGNNSFPNDNAYQPMFNNYPTNSQTNTGPLSFGTSQQQPLPNGPGMNVQPPPQTFASHDFNPTNAPPPPPTSNNYGVFQNQNQSPNMFQNNLPPASTNFYNNNPSSQNSTTTSENDYSNYWPETSNNNSNSVPPMYPSNNGPSQSYSCSPPPQQAPPPMKGGVGQRFRPRGSGPMGNPRGPRGGGAGMFPKNSSNTEMCRFFFKNGKCKFDSRCNYSHVIPSSGDQKPPIRF